MKFKSVICFKYIFMERNIYCNSLVVHNEMDKPTTNLDSTGYYKERWPWIKSRSGMALNFYLIILIVQTRRLPIITYLVLWRIALEVGNLMMSRMSKLESKHLSTPNQRNGSSKDYTNWQNDGFKPQITMVYISNIDFMFC